MSNRLAGKVAIITGGAGGIGQATVLRFVAEGAKTIVADINVEAGRKTAELAGINAFFIQLDAGDEASWRSLIAQTLDRFGGLHILVNNAAQRTPLTIEQTTLDLWRANQRVTSEGVFLGTKLAGEAMTSGGAIVNLASLGAFVGLPASFPYSAAKGAVRALSRSAAVHFAKQGRNIRVNVVAPGFTLTDDIERQAKVMAEQQGVTAQDVIGNYVKDIPLNRPGEPRELADAILFLASDEASFITGAELLVDGGATAV